MINLEIVNNSKKVFINYIEENIDTIVLDEYYEYLVANMKYGYKGKLHFIKKLLRNKNNTGKKSGNGKMNRKDLNCLLMK